MPIYKVEEYYRYVDQNYDESRPLLVRSYLDANNSHGLVMTN